MPLTTSVVGGERRRTCQVDVAGSVTRFRCSGNFEWACGTALRAEAYIYARRRSLGLLQTAMKSRVCRGGRVRFAPAQEDRCCGAKRPSV